jgi:putative ABC transport system ATP-binding protein
MFLSVNHILQKEQQVKEMSAQDMAVRVSNLQHFYGQGETEKQVLYDVNLTIKKGTLTLLEGASGSGKTTLLTLLGCLRRVQKGSVQLLGNELLGATESQLIAFRHKIGFIFQAHNLHESLSAIQNVRMGLDVHRTLSKESGETEAERLLTLFGLQDRLYYFPKNLSGGQKQRVAIARALVGKPRIVFADEPTAALDKDTALHIVSYLRTIAKELGTTILMVTHDSKLRSLADRVIMLDEGRIVEDTLLN